MSVYHSLGTLHDNVSMHRYAANLEFRRHATDGGLAWRMRYKKHQSTMRFLARSAPKLFGNDRT